MSPSAEELKIGVYAKKPLPNYDVVPLRSDEIGVAAIQMGLKTIDGKNPKPGIKENLDYMLWLIDAAQHTPLALLEGNLDLLAFPEFDLQGFNFQWTREDWLRISIEMPGEETELIGKKAKEYNCYIEAQAYTKEKDWPGHYFNCSFIVGPSGEVIHRHWKNTDLRIEGATSVHHVLDEFVERYGRDAIWPVARTDIGNIATFVCHEGLPPEPARAFAIRGAEILVRSTGGAAVHYPVRGRGDQRLGMQAHCMFSDMYGVFANNALAPVSPLRFSPNRLADMGCGSSMIIDNFGRILEQAGSPAETVVSARIPIASFRKGHSIPVVKKELYDEGIWAEYVSKWPPNMYKEYLPENSTDYLDNAYKQSRW